MNNPLKDFRPESLCLLKESQEDYWRYARKGPHDFSVYTEKSSIYEPPSKEKFRESSDVLVRWTDGLLYLANIIKVEDEYSRCAVKFEDGSQFWALYKDIYKGPHPEGEIQCTVCDSGSSLPPDEIVICDKCSVGYHQLCHIPKIDRSVLKLDVSWNCRKCIFASTAKTGGALKKGSNAQVMMVMKQTLPYSPDALTWDSSHRSNLQQTYCYCGGPGEWYSKMLQCSRCRQWFHEACLQCLEEPLLYGDRFYIFVCSVCNSGPEFLRRLPLRWPDIAHLVLFNLTVIHGKKFFEFDSTILSFLKDKWSHFQIKGEAMSRMPGDERKKRLLEILQKCKSRFTFGKEIKKKTLLWGLKSRVPPPTPVITLPDSGAITNDVLDSFSAASRKLKSVIKTNNSDIPIKKLRKPSVPDNESLINERTETQSLQKKEKLHSSREEDKPRRASHKPKKEKRKLPHRQARCRQSNGTRKLLDSSVSTIEISDSEDTSSSSQGTLNAIIPHPTNFEGVNNPFLSNYKRNSKKSVSVNSTLQIESNNVIKNVQRIQLRVRPQRKCISNKTSVIEGLLNGTSSKIVNNKCKVTETKSPTSSSVNSSVNTFFGAVNQIGDSEKYSVLAKRIAPDGSVQYLVEWDSLNPS
ncbi:metal-response element-binding transcription factor 2-like [Uloborus diversus]|uniref:metal-response element-binding transcription factor 2-like n=1 Tax=Uloborus diversus TaxID=327109 RepID=UPI002409BF54|nr:metal-response element-binding transcription factor 2-like [Uloborus diversus]